MLGQIKQITEIDLLAQANTTSLTNTAMGVIVLLLLIGIGTGLAMVWKFVTRIIDGNEERQNQVVAAQVSYIDEMKTTQSNLVRVQSQHSDTCHATALKVDAIIDQVHAVHESLREWGEAHGDQEIVTYAERAERRLTEHLARTGR